MSSIPGTTRTRHGPAERPDTVGTDRAPEQRPGIPMETEPAADPGAHRTRPQHQPGGRFRPRRRGLDRLTPVFGTAQPPRGLSGLVRRFAYGIPEHEARHWMLLLGADRIDIFEGRIGETLARPLHGTRLEPLARAVERNPLPVLGAALAAGLLLRRALR